MSHGQARPLPASANALPSEREAARRSAAFAFLSGLAIAPSASGGGSPTRLSEAPARDALPDRVNDYDVGLSPSSSHSAASSSPSSHSDSDLSPSSILSSLSHSSVSSRSPTPSGVTSSPMDTYFSRTKKLFSLAINSNPKQLHPRDRPRNRLARKALEVQENSALDSVTGSNRQVPTSYATTSKSAKREYTTVFIEKRSGVALGLSSVIPYREEALRQRRQKVNQSRTESSYGLPALPKDRKRRSISYAHLLKQEIQAATPLYDPHSLENPSLQAGRNRTVISLPGMIGSILQYRRPEDIKSKLNEEFARIHPNVHDTLKLSQIRSLKRLMLHITTIQDLEVSSLAMAFVYLEKLIFKGKIVKENRKLVAAVCLYLACKVNEKKSFKCEELLDEISKVLGVSTSDICNREFQIFSELQFRLYVPEEEFMPHFEKISKTLDYRNYGDYFWTEGN